MDAPNVSGFFDDLKFAYVFPFVAFGLMAINRLFSGLISRKNRYGPLLWRLITLFCLLLFLCLIVSLMYQDRITYLYIQHQSPLFIWFVTLVLTIVTITGICAIVYWEL